MVSANLESEPILVEHHPLTHPHPGVGFKWFSIFYPWGGWNHQAIYPTPPGPGGGLPPQMLQGEMLEEEEETETGERRVARRGREGRERDVNI